MKIFVGLGNPGAEYENTRHNIGFMAVDTIWQKLSGDKMKEKFQSLYGEIFVNGEKYVFVKPLTFMNNSGQSVGKWGDFYQVDVEDIFVFYDDLDIPFGDVRLKTGGSAGGHNGLKSLIAHLGSQDFNRVRLGIDRQPGNTVNYVLGKFNKTQLAFIETDILPKTIQLVEGLGNQTFAQLMNVYNQRKKVE